MDLYNKTFNYFIIGFICLIIILMLFGVYKGYNLSLIGDDIQDSKRYWENTDLTLSNYVFDPNTHTIAISLKNEKDVYIQIFSFKIADYTDYTPVLLDPEETYVYLVPVDCVYGNKFEYSVSLNYLDLDNNEEHIFNGEYLFKGYCE